MNKIVNTDNPIPLLPLSSKKNTRDRIQPYLDWLQQTDGNWTQPDLSAYRDHLRQRSLSESSIGAHLSTIRGQYNRLVKSNALRELMFYWLKNSEKSFVEQKATVDEWITRIENAIHPSAAPLEVITMQDAQAHYRMNVEQARSLMDAPGTDTLRGLRDTALICLMLCTGLREEEVSNLDLGDLYKEYEGFAALEIRKGKGNKQRMVLYGDFLWVLDYLRAWADNAGIYEGPVFRGFWKDGSVRPGRMNKRSIQYVLSKYQIERRNPSTGRVEKYVPTPHDYRYTYAGLAADSGMPLSAIRKQMGHSNERTTEIYTGDKGAAFRKPKDFYRK